MRDMISFTFLKIALAVEGSKRPLKRALQAPLREILVAWTIR